MTGPRPPRPNGLRHPRSKPAPLPRCPECEVCDSHLDAAMYGFLTRLDTAVRTRDTLLLRRIIQAYHDYHDALVAGDLRWDDIDIKAVMVFGDGWPWADRR